MTRKFLCLFLSLFVLTAACGCKKNTANDYSSAEVEVIYEVEESQTEQADVSSVESTVSGNGNNDKKPQKNTSVVSSTNQPVSSAAPTAPAASEPAQQTETVTGKNSRPYLGSATVADGRIDVNDGHLYFSPYSWYNGGSYRLNTVCGGYLKVAFTGSYLAIGVDDSNIGSSSRSSFEIHGYIDSQVGESASINRTLDSASNGRIVFADNLSGGTHYATIYLSHTGEGDAWYNGAQNSLRINGVYINPGEQVVDLADTDNKVQPRRVIFYGDSITEAVGTGGAEYGYVVQLAKKMHAEYGQLGNGGMGWTLGGARALNAFYIIDDKSGYWRYYFEGASRLVNDDINAGFIDGEPDAVFVNMGTNDAFANKTGGFDSDFTKLVCSEWLPTIRSAVGSSTDIYLIIPFDYGKSASLEKRFKNALVTATNEYKAASGDNSRFHVLDLEKEGYNIVRDNSSDSIHPNAYGASKLASKLYDLIKAK